MSRRARILCFALGATLVALVGVAFAPALSAEFLDFDDDKLLLLNRHWRGLTTRHVGWMLTTPHMGHWQPLTWLSFGIDWTLHGLTSPGHPEAGAYHATNVAIHALSALALFWLAWRLLTIALPDVGEARRLLAAAGAAALWAAHPLRVESVVWLTERRDVLSSSFAVLAVGVWLDWAAVGHVERRTRGLTLATVACAALALAALLAGIDLSDPRRLTVSSWPLVAVGTGAWLASIATTVRGSDRAPAFALAAACLLLSLSAKAWAMVLPAVLLVLDVWPLGRAQRGRLTAVLVEKLPLLVPALVCARLAHWAQASSVGVMAPWAEHGLDARLAQALYGLVYYPARALLPIDLLPIYPLPRHLSLAEPGWLAPALAAVALVVTVVALRRRAPALAAACAAYAILVSPVLGVVQSGPQLVADRYTHLATMPFAILIAGVAARVSERHAIAVGVAAVGLLVACAAGTWRYATIWRTPTSLWEHAYAVAPRNAMVLNSLGALRTRAAPQEPDPARALALLRDAANLHHRALAVEPTPQTFRGLSQIHGLMSLYDRPNAAQHHQQAVEFSRRALALAQARKIATPDFVLVHGVDLVNVGQLEQGIELLRWYVQAEPDSVTGLVNLGGALTLAGRGADAVPLLARACALEPNDVRSWIGLARAQQASGDPEAALSSWSRAQRLAPQDPAIAEQIRKLGAARVAPPA